MGLIRRAAGIALIAVAAVLGGLGLHDVLSGAIAPGIDFLPLRHAAESLLRGESIYTDPLFVYPPTAAVLLLPTALGTPTAAFVWWVLTGVAALLLAAVLVARAAPPRHRLAVLGAAALGLTGGVLATRSIFVGNVSELLVPVAVGVLLAFHRGRWHLGCALLAASLLVKPLLAALILIPVLRRRWSALARTILPAGVLLLLSTRLIPGGADFPAVLRYCLTGTNLHGGNALNNLSLRGWAEAHHAPYALATAVSLTLLALTAARITRELRRPTPLPPTWLGPVLLLATFLAGAISEVHFLLTTYATALLHLATHRPTPREWLRFAPALAMLAAPASYVTLLPASDNNPQSWLVLAELLLLTAFLTAPVTTAPSPAAADGVPAPVTGDPGRVSAAAVPSLGVPGGVPVAAAPVVDGPGHVSAPMALVRGGRDCAPAVVGDVVGDPGGVSAEAASVVADPGRALEALSRRPAESSAAAALGAGPVGSGPAFAGDGGALPARGVADAGGMGDGLVVQG